MKICNKCEKTLEFFNFHKNKKHHDGYSYTCKKCCNERKNELRRSRIKLFEIDIIEGEIWKDCVGFEGWYQVSNKGRVIGLQREFIRSNGRVCTRRRQILKYGITPNGYTKYTLRKQTESKIISGHILVGLAFIPNPENKPELNHKDGNKLNNNDWNLEWCTEIENIQHSIRIGLRHPTNQNQPFGENAGAAKLTDKKVLEMRQIRKMQKLSYKIIAEMFEVSEKTVNAACIGKTWKHLTTDIISKTR